MEAIARGYLPRVPVAPRRRPQELVLNRGPSGQPADHLWFVDFDVVREGLPIEGARVVFRVNNGNLIQFGTENLPAPGAAVPPTKLTQKDALDAVAKFVGGFQRRPTRFRRRAAACTCCRPTSPASASPRASSSARAAASPRSGSSSSTATA